MRISDWSSDVCSSDLIAIDVPIVDHESRWDQHGDLLGGPAYCGGVDQYRIGLAADHGLDGVAVFIVAVDGPFVFIFAGAKPAIKDIRSEEHTSELQSLMRISYAVFCLKKKTKQ